MPIEWHYNVGGCFRAPGEDLALAEDAAAAGFEGIWIGDHFVPWLDNRPYTHHILPWLGSVAERVPDATIGTCVSCPTIRYRPPVLAQALATIDNAYPGRLEFGVGTGEALNEARFYDGDWPDWGTLAGMLIESIDVMETLWESDEYVDHDGKYYQYDEMKLYTKPRTRIPFHWAAWGPQSARCAGKYAGNLLTAGDAELINETLAPAFEAGRSERETDRETDGTISVQLPAHVGDPGDIVDELRANGEYTPHDELETADPRDIQSIANDRLADVSDAELRKSNNVTDDPTDLIPTVERLAAAGVDRIILVSKVGDPRRTIDAIANEVMPRVE
ncbi:LLM class flavin-dependent oxidoreductase [Natronorubrum sp. JWXQ-INN-674]|uniref:LLM class flavin-dependent oxidoreductase n=1 Tax=Natronorubrum halalkaliphilum TaxID=2691917 RepID=A0A6B0VG63_9EURY|nr:LLM class flavin-dependent oxidoreductase [Natronorubrum halalkaliphilum]MXV60488.1 LLM class flavin-dependent oxidoreductase [Natronorubrum halalkaliphilum]